MSEREPDTQQAVPESKSKVKLVRNAKGDTQIELSVVEGCAADELRRIRDLAVNEYQTIHGIFYPPAQGGRLA